MANGKTFADMKKPVRQPTPEQIAAFEETGCAAGDLDPQTGMQTRKAVDTQTRKPAFAESREHRKLETSIAASPPSQKHGNAPLQNSVDAGPQVAVDAQTRQPGNTETRVSGLVVRLTIDLDEPVHTRFKTACVMTRRKMVDEVRVFIERRIEELEGEAGRVP